MAKVLDGLSGSETQLELGIEGVVLEKMGMDQDERSCCFKKIRSRVLS
jgi:hypothetical protein